MMTGARGPAPWVAPSDIDTREEFARGLTELRGRAGLSVRALARALNTPVATVGDYCSGRHLPGPSQQKLFCAMLRLCGVEESALDGWVAAVARLRHGTDGRARRVAAPYRGLEPFGAADRARFFGRKAATEEVLGRLRARVAGSVGGLVLVVGPSGAGKSSLLRAGVQARVQADGLGDGDEEWSTVVLTPGDRPLEALRDGLAGLEEPQRLVIVDQLEEVFAASAQEQERFLGALERMASADTVVLAGLRADFYERALAVAGLLASLRADPVLLGPMTEAELRSAIVGPARVAGVQVEAGLVELLLADLAPRDPTGFAHEAGSLPLLSHALLQSWQRAEGNRLTVADYRAAGGLQGAVRQTAEELYTELSAQERQLAQRVFMRLVRVPEDGPAIRRRAARHELDELGQGDRPGAVPGAVRTEDVLARFIAARLVTIDTNTVQLSHEALLTAWPRLASWLADNRAALRLHRQLTDAAGEWVRSDRDPALLLRGTRLHLIAEWAQASDHRAELIGDERALLAASQDLALSEQRTARQRARRMRVLIAASVAFGIAALVLAAVALHARSSATRARDDAFSRQIAVQARSLSPTDPSLAMQLAVLARRIAPTTDATSSLLDASGGEMPKRLLGPLGPAYLTISADSQRAAVAYSAADQIRIYALEDGMPHQTATITAGPASAQVFAVAISSDGRLLAAGGTNHQIGIWSLVSPARPTRIATLTGLAGTVYGLSFSPEGRELAAADDTSAVKLWSLQGDRPPAPLPAPSASGTTLHAIAFSPDGRVLAAGGTGGTLLLWAAARPGAPPVTATAASAMTLTALAFSPDGRTLAAAGQGKLVYRFALHDGAAPTAMAALHGFTTYVDALAFSPGGQNLVAGGSDNMMRIWSTASPASETTLRHPAAVTGVAFVSGGTRVLSIDAAGTLRAWSFPPPSTWLAPGSVFGLGYTASGNELAVISSGTQGTAQLFRPTGSGGLVPIATVPTLASFGPVAGAGALSANGALLAVANARAQVQLFDVADPHHPRPVGPVLTGATPTIEQMSFDPSARLLAAGDDGGHVRLWNIADPARPIAEPTLDRNGSAQLVFGVAFSPDGHVLASAGADGRVRLWNVAQPGHAQPLAIAGQFNGYAYTVAFSPDGHTLVAGGADRTVRLWNISDPAHPKVLTTPLTGPTSGLYSVAVSPDGSTIAGASLDGSVWLWNITHPTTPARLATLTPTSANLLAVSFQPHSNQLIAAGADQHLYVWNDNPAQATSTICRLAGTPLTRTEWTQYVQAGTYRPPCH